MSREFLQEVRRIQKPVAAIYAAGFDPAALPAEPLSRPPGGTGDEGELRGPVRDLVAGSACTAKEFRSAVEEKDAQFLGWLSRRLVIWRAMLLEPMKAEEAGEVEKAEAEAEGRVVRTQERTQRADRVVARLMADGGLVTAEFPSGCKAAGLTPGKSIVIAGEARQTDDGWVIRVMWWGLAADLDAGGAKTVYVMAEIDGRIWSAELVITT